MMGRSQERFVTKRLIRTRIRLRRGIGLVHRREWCSEVGKMGMV